MQIDVEHITVGPQTLANFMQRYLRLDFGLETMSFLGFRCNDRLFDVLHIEPMHIPTMANLWCMLNTAFWVETDLDKRAFLYLDSVLLSGDWGD